MNGAIYGRPGLTTTNLCKKIGMDGRAFKSMCKLYRLRPDTKCLTKAGYVAHIWYETTIRDKVVPALKGYWDYDNSNLPEEYSMLKENMTSKDFEIKELQRKNRELEQRLKQEESKGRKSHNEEPVITSDSLLSSSSPRDIAAYMRESGQNTYSVGIDIHPMKARGILVLFSDDEDDSDAQCLETELCFNISNNSLHLEAGMGVLKKIISTKEASSVKTTFRHGA